MAPATSRSEPRRASARARAARRYVAMGDSFTAGTGEEADGARWADRVAARLRAASPALGYHNLAVAGARSDAVAGEQLEPAVSLEPDVVTLVCGANDVLLSVRPDLGLYAATLSAMLERLSDALPGAAILTATTPDLADLLALHRRSHRRVAGGMAGLADATRLVAARHGIACLELAGHPETGARDNVASDGYHPSEAGHRRAAAAFCEALHSRFAIDVAPDSREEVV